MEPWRKERLNEFVRKHHDRTTTFAEDDALVAEAMKLMDYPARFGERKMADLLDKKLFGETKNPFSRPDATRVPKENQGNETHQPITPERILRLTQYRFKGSIVREVLQTEEAYKEFVERYCAVKVGNRAKYFRPFFPTPLMVEAFKRYEAGELTLVQFGLACGMSRNSAPTLLGRMYDYYKRTK